MSERIAGKTFRTQEEARAAGARTLSDEEIATEKALFDEWNRTRSEDSNAPSVPYGGRFSDDLAGTEYDPDGPGYPDEERRDPRF